MDPQPAYACALLMTRGGDLLVERRTTGARHAAGCWTCFGGRARVRESWHSCLRRELTEELGGTIRWSWPPSPAVVDLWQGQSWVARFAQLRVSLGQQPRVLPGRGWVLLPADQFSHPRLSPWHRQVLAAWRKGCRYCRL